MDDSLDYGKRLTSEEYDREIVALYTDLPPVPSKKQNLHVCRRELDLAISHRLGCDFPRARREALWVIQQRIQGKHLWLMFRHLLRKIFTGDLRRDARNLAAYVVDEYADVLSKAELEAFFGEDETQQPMLPVDVERE